MAPSISHQQVLAGLSSLTRAELENVRRRCSYYLQHRSQTPEPVEEEDWLLYGIGSELQRRGLEQQTDFKIKKPTSFASFQTQSEAVRAILLDRVKLSAVQRRALGETCAYELARYMESWSNPAIVNRSSLLHHVGKVPDAINYAYPGYLASGLIHLIIR